MIPHRKLRPKDVNQLTIEWTSLASTIEPSVPAIIPPEKPIEAECPSVVVAPSPMAATAGSKPATSFTSRVRRSSKGVAARLPVPKPLAAAVAKGRFGQDEEGRPIRPAADEVRAITENQADKLVAILDRMTVAPVTPIERESSLGVFQSVITAYSEDFGDQAARKLEAYARRQASLDGDEREDTGWHR